MNPEGVGRGRNKAEKEENASNGIAYTYVYSIFLLSCEMHTHLPSALFISTDKHFIFIYVVFIRS